MCLFGIDDVKVEGDVEVIEISDNTMKIISSDNVAVEMDDNDEEVNSPAVFRRPNVKRKLFDEEDMPTDRESSTDSGTYFIDLVNAGHLPTHVRMSRTLPKPTTFGDPQVGPSTKSPHTSSCASNSPIGWCPKNRI